MKKLALYCLACGLLPALSAQAANPPALPPGPLLNKAPEFAQWTITNKITEASTDAATTGASPKPDPSPSPTPRHRQKSAESAGKIATPSAEQQTVVTKTQLIRYEETSTGTGPKLQKWCVPDMQVTIEEGSPPVVSLPSSRGSTYMDYSTTDFPGFEWVSERNFTGVEKVAGQECLIFRDVLNTKGTGSASEPPVTMVASINAATRLPVALEAGDETRIYVFGLAPTAALALPPEVETVVEQWRKTMSQSALMPSKP